MAKSFAQDDVYSELVTPEGEKKLYKIAKSRNKVTKDLTQIKHINNKNREVLTDESKIKKGGAQLINQSSSYISPFGTRGPSTALVSIIGMHR